MYIVLVLSGNLRRLIGCILVLCISRRRWRGRRGIGRQIVSVLRLDVLEGFVRTARWVELGAGGLDRLVGLIIHLGMWVGHIVSGCDRMVA